MPRIGSMSKQFPSDQKDKFMLRLPDGMRERIAAAAEKGGRSMNSEIVHRLENSFGAALASEPGSPRAMTLLTAIAEQAESLRALGRELAALDEKKLVAEFVEKGLPSPKRRARKD